MDHAITVGDVLLVVGIAVGIIGALILILGFAGAILSAYGKGMSR